MADPLLLGVYAVGRMLASNSAINAKEQEKEDKEREARQKANAEKVVSYYGKKTPNGPIRPLNFMEKNFPNYEVTHVQFGTGAPVKQDPITKPVPVYTVEGRGNDLFTETDLDKLIVPMLGKFGTKDEIMKLATRVGTQDVTKTTGRPIGNPNFFPQDMRTKPEDEKVFKFYAEGPAGQPITGDTETEVRQALQDLRVTDFDTIPIGQIEMKGDKRVSKVEYPDQEDDPVLRTTKVDAYKINSTTGKPDLNSFGPVDLIEYYKSPSSFKVVGQPYELNLETKERNFLKGLEIADLKGAMDQSLNVLNVSYTLDGEDKKFSIPAESKTVKPYVQLQLLQDFIAGLPKTESGAIDFRKVRMGDEQIANLAFSAAQIVKLNNQARTQAGDLIPNNELVVDAALYVNNSYRQLRLIPGFEQELRYIANLDTREAIESVTNQHSVNPETGMPQEVVVIEQSTSVPEATLNDPSGVDANAQQSNNAAPVTVFSAAPYPPRYKDTVEFVLADMSGNGTPDNVRKAKRNFGTLINYKKTPDGGLARGPNREFLILDDQPSLDFLNYVTQTTIPGEGGNLYPIWKNMLLLGPQRQNVNPDVEKAIRLQFNAEVGDNFELGKSLIMAFSPDAIGNKRDQILFTAQTGKNAKKYEKLQQQKLAEADSAATAIRIGDLMLRNYFLDNGQEIPFGTALGQFFVGIDGALYNLRTALPSVGRLVDTLLGEGKLREVTQSEAFTTAEASIYGFDENGERAFVNVLENSTADEIAAMAEKRGQTVAQFKANERAARKANRALFEKTVAGIVSNDEAVKKLAIRNYYRFMLAYSVAAAIQGGTGGRTISDQDVQNVLNSFKMDTGLVKPSTERAIIREVISMMSGREKFARAIAAGGNEAYAALKLQELLLPSSMMGTNMTIDSFIEAVEQPGPEDDQADQTGAAAGYDPDADTRTEAQKLKAVNDAQDPTFGEEFDSLDEARQAGINVNRILLNTLPVQE